ncbi:single-stranded DNA-binding protein [bacterium]|nr:single-stranded DNA-binding protein [bacterium]
MSLNKVMLIGRLGKDPEVRYLDNNVAVARFSMATSEYYKDNTGNRIEKTEWHNIVVWRGLADIASKFLKKGSQVYIEGKLATRSWDDQKGEKRYTTEIVANELQMLDTKPRSDGDGGQQQQGGGYGNSSSGGGSRVSENDGYNTNMDDDLPF